MEFSELYKKAFSVSNESLKTKDCEIGSVGCALESETGKVYLYQYDQQYILLVYVDWYRGFGLHQLPLIHPSTSTSKSFDSHPPYLS